MHETLSFGPRTEIPGRLGPPLDRAFSASGWGPCLGASGS